MKVFVIDTKNRRKIFIVESQEKIENLKTKIREKNGINNNTNITLLYGGNILEDNETIDEYDIEEGGAITYLGEFKGGIYL